MSQSRTILVVVLILLLGFAFRIWNLAEMPSGFAEEEITGIRIIETIRSGTIYVFFDTGDTYGIESFYYALAVTQTRLVGDGLIGYRVFSLWLGMLTLALMFTVARRLFGKTVGIVSTFAMSIGLYPIFLARTTTHHVLLPFMMLITLWAVTQAYYLRPKIRPHMSITLAFTVLGISVTLTTYAHPTGFLAGIGVAIFAFQVGRTARNYAKDLWWNSGYALAMAFILGIPYFISFLRDMSNSGIYLFWAERPTSIVGLLESIGATLAAFLWLGDSDPSHNIPNLPLLHFIEPVLLMIGLIYTVRYRHLPNYLLVLIFFLISLLPDMWVAGGTDFRLLTPALPAVYMLIGVGVVEGVRFIMRQTTLPSTLSRLQELPLVGTYPTSFVRLAVGLIIIGFGIIIYQNQRDLRAWAVREDTQFAYNTSVGQVAQHLDTHPHDAQTSLVCVGQIRDVATNDFTQPIDEAQLLEWMLHRENMTYRLANCRTDFVFIDGGVPMTILFTNPADTNVLPPPLLSWFRLAHPENAPIDNLGEASIWTMAPHDALAAELTRLQDVSVAFYPRDANGSLESVPLPINFEGNLTFMGFEPLPDREFYRTGDVLTLVTYWRVNDQVPSDIGVFVRLNDIPQASPYTEVNGFGVDATRLQAGDVVVQVGFLTLPPQLRSHEYLLTLGLYEGLTVNQLQVYDRGTQIPRGNYLLIDDPFQVRATPQ